jgi:hypothetical protein
MASVVAVPGVQSLSSGQLKALASAAKSIDVPVDWLATIISFETGGSFSPTQLNHAGSGAFGLIQFLPSTAAGLLGLDSTAAADAGKAMSFAEQLQKMVVPYFKNFGTKFQSLQDLYLAVFYPAAMNKSPDAVIGSAPSKTYTQNAGLDRDGKGYITKNDVTAAITRHYDSADDRVGIPGSWFQVIAGLAAAGAALAAAQRFLPPEYKLPEIPRKYTQTVKGIAEWPVEKAKGLLP